MALLEVENLTVNFYTADGVVKAVDNLTYRVDRGEMFGVVGESGAGKSVTALSLLRLIESPGQIESGHIRFEDPDTVESFKEEFEEHVVDLAALRAEHDLQRIAEDLQTMGVRPDALAGDAADGDSDLVELAARDEFDLADVVGRGYAADLGLVNDEAFIIEDGSRQYLEVLQAPERAVRMLRGNNVAMIFQDAQTALNPVYSVGEQIAEAIRHHLDYTDEEAKKRTIQLLDRVGIPEAEIRDADYPHEFSGGMQQRVVIAMALSCNPDLLVCDEPTTALDVTIEAKILDLITELAEDFDTAVQLITHDLGVIAETCDRVMVMYAGRPVEKADVEELFYDPKHPYTVGLMSSIPRIGDNRERLQTIPGTMPDLVELPPGCSFHPRCPFAEETCTRHEPPLVDPETGEPVTSADDSRGAACLAYTGELDGTLEYSVDIEGELTGAPSSRGDD